MLVSVASLQSKARKKLGEGVWFVTPRSLQQATPWQVARYKAKWFARRGVFDLCCGIGGDAVRLAQRGPVVAVDTDRELVRMTQANLLANIGKSGTAAVLCDDARDVARDREFFIHVDPNRRPGQTRFTRPDQYQPPWDDVQRMVSGAVGAVVKLAPAAQLDATISERTQRAWTSLQGSVREQSVLYGEAMQGDAGTRIAISLAYDGTAERFAAPLVDQRPKRVEAPGMYLVDPDAAIRASGLTETFAVTHDLATMAGPAGFLTCDQLPTAAGLMNMAVVQRVLWKGTCDDRKLRRELRAQQDVSAYHQGTRDRTRSDLTRKAITGMRRTTDHTLDRSYINAPIRGDH